MKKIIIAILAVFAIAACNRPFEENYPELLLDRYNITLKADGGSVQMMVYYSDAWTAEVTIRLCSMCSATMSSPACSLTMRQA